MQLITFMQAVGEFKAGKVEYRADKTGIVHVRFGKSSFSADDLIVNLMAIVVSRLYMFLPSFYKNLVAHLAILILFSELH